jgi:hypothetical protein
MQVSDIAISQPYTVIRPTEHGNISFGKAREAEQCIIELGSKALLLIKNKTSLNKLLVGNEDFNKFLGESDSIEAQKINYLLKTSESVSQMVSKFIRLDKTKQKSLIMNKVSTTKKGEPLNLNQLVDKLNTVFESASFKSTLNSILEKLKTQQIKECEQQDKGSEFDVKDNQELIEDKRPNSDPEISEMQTGSLQQYCTKQKPSLDNHLESISQLIQECNQRADNNQTSSSPEEFLKRIINKGSDFIQYVRNNQELIKNEFPNFDPKIFEMQTESLRKYYAYEKPFSSATRDIEARRQEIETREQENALTDKLLLLHKSRDEKDEKIDEISIQEKIQKAVNLLERISNYHFSKPVVKA